MAYVSDFNSNVVYGAADINTIRQAISTAGIINESENAMKVVAIGGGKVRISEGQALFADGARIAVDVEGVELNVIGAGKNYVFVKREMNSAEPYISTDPPAGDYVPLAEVTGQTVTDTREFAAFKIMRGLGNGYFVKKNVEYVTPPLNTTWQKAHEIDVETALFKFGAICNPSYPSEHGGARYYCTWDFENDTIAGFRRTSDGSVYAFYNAANGFEISSDRHIKLIYNGNKIEFWQKRESSGGNDPAYSASFEFYAM